MSLNNKITSIVIIICCCLQNCKVLKTNAIHNEQTNGILCKGGYWFDGERFIEREQTYVINEYFSQYSPDSIENVIDLAGKYIIPPFAEAHNHNIENSSIFRIDDIINNYFDIGVFYVKNPNILPRSREVIEPMVNKINSIDVAFANGGLSVKGGHPYAMIQRNIRLNPSWTENDGDGEFYHIINSFEDFERRWPMILKFNPDFIKTYLLYSEEYEERKSDSTKFLGWKGLDPALLPIIVNKIQSDGLNVSTHVETAIDFHHAVIAGVNEINHIPGFRPQPNYSFSTYAIQADDAVEAYKKGITVVTTLERGVPNRDDYSSVDNKQYNDLQRENLQTLKNAGVKIAIGCDYYRGYTRPEVNYLKYLNVFSNLELIKMWSETTPRTIFPKRMITKLNINYEASFLVLEKNPLKDLSALNNIVLKVKQGTTLDY